MDKAEIVFEKYAGLGTFLKGIFNIGKKSKYIKKSIPDNVKMIFPNPSAPYSQKLKEMAYSKKYVKTRPKPPVSVWSPEQKAQGLATEKMFKDLGL